MLKGQSIRRFFPAAYLLSVSLVLYFLSAHWVYDDPFITYRYAANLQDGEGFVYNAGQPVLSTTSPFFALLLSLLGRVWADLPRLAVLIGSVSLAAGGLMAYELALLYSTPVIGWTALLFLPTFPLVMSTLSSETPLYLALILGTILAYERKQYPLTGLLSGLVILTRPDGLLVPAILAAHYLLLVRKPIPWKAVAVFLAIILAWVGFSWLYFGSPLPVTLVAKQQQGEMTISQRFLPGTVTVFGWYASRWGYRVAAVLAVLGAFTIVLKKRRWLLLLAWTTGYFAAYSLLGVSRYFWYYAPLVPGLVVLTGAGLGFLWDLRRRFTGQLLRLAPVCLVIALMAFVGAYQLREGWRFRSRYDKRIAVYRQVGDWLRENTEPDAAVGTLEVGAIGYYSERQMVDFAGLIQPDVALQLKRDTTYEDAALYAIERYRPKYIALIGSTFARFREEAMTDTCQPLEMFEDDGFSVEVFACAWQ